MMLIEIRDLKREKAPHLPINISSFALAAGQRVQLADPTDQFNYLLQKENILNNLPEDTVWMQGQPVDFFKTNLPLEKQLENEAQIIAREIFTFPQDLFKLKPKDLPPNLINILRWTKTILSNPSLIIARDDLVDLGPYFRNKVLEKLTPLFADKNTTLLQIVQNNIDFSPLIADYTLIKKGDIISISRVKTGHSRDLKIPSPDYKILALKDYSGDHLEDWDIDIAQNQSWTFICDGEQTADGLARALAGIEKPEKGTRQCLLKPREILYFESSPFFPQKSLGQSFKLFSNHLSSPKKTKQNFKSFQEKIKEYNYLQPENVLSFFPEEITPAQELNIILLWSTIFQPRLLILNNPRGLIQENIYLLQSIIKNQRTNILITTTRTDLELTHKLGIVFENRILEDGPQNSIRENPSHPYSRAILAPDCSFPAPFSLREEINGCPFHPVCEDSLSYCGWNGADLRALLQNSHLDDSIHSYALQGNDLFLEPAYTSEFSWQDLIEEIKALMFAQNEPLSGACLDVEYENRKIRALFPSQDPPDLKKVTSHRRVACHLFK